MYVNISYVRMCEPRFLFDTICSILVLIQFHGYSELRPTGIPQRFPPKCHLTVFNLCYPPWPSWCMCPVGCGLASGSRFSISNIFCPSGPYVRYSVLRFWIVCEGKYLFTCMISSTHPRNVLWKRIHPCGSEIFIDFLSAFYHMAKSAKLSLK